MNLKKLSTLKVLPFLFIISFNTDSIAQEDFPSLKNLEQSAKIYNDWLISSGIGELIEYHNLKIKDEFVIFYFKGTKKGNDPRYLKTGWPQLKKNFYSTEKQALETKLLRMLSLFTDISFDRIRMNIVSNDEKLFKIEIYPDNGWAKTNLTSSNSLAAGPSIQVLLSDFKSFNQQDTIEGIKTLRILNSKVDSFITEKYKNKSWETAWGLFNGSVKIFPQGNTRYFEVLCLQNEVLRNGYFEKLIIEVNFEYASKSTYIINLEVTCSYYDAFICSSKDKYYEAAVTPNNYGQNLERYVINLQKELLTELLK